MVRVKTGEQQVLKLGNLDAKRDWGYAKEFVEAMWLMLQQDKPDDFVIATGEAHTVREFVEESCKHLDIDLTWEGAGSFEKGIDRRTGKIMVELDPHYRRPTEVDLLLGDAAKAKKVLGWNPKVGFQELVKIMVEYDLEDVRRGCHPLID